jgi:hypothetical protein
MIKRYDIGTRRKKGSGAADDADTSSRSRTFPAAELTRE